jgi:methylenetetrahydrofolate dehydrogenase (NADP+) / methenyltetrahydrofolate cyclohydrolase
MPPVVMAGAPVVEAVMAEVRRAVEALAAGGVTVGLGTILVGDDPASAGYIRKKQEACEAVGISSPHVHIDAGAGQADLMAAVEAFNAEPAVDAFLLQNPVPAGFDFNQALAAIDPEKDADGLHPVNLGKLALGVDAPLACTPAGIQAMLAHYGVPVEGRHVVIVGRGATLGRPLALLLSLKRPGANAAVTVVHTGVPDWRRYTREADIVIGAAGVPNMITADDVRPGAAVVGGGISWEGRRLISDVDESVAEVAGWVTPRLGGVGPTTVAMLLRNAVEAAARRRGLALPAG